MRLPWELAGVERALGDVAGEMASRAGVLVPGWRGGVSSRRARSPLPLPPNIQSRSLSSDRSPFGTPNA